MPKAKTQLAQSRAIRARMTKLFPELASVKDDLGHLLDVSQNAPPNGESDETISPVQYNQLRSIHTALGKFLVAQLFDTKGPRVCDGCGTSRLGFERKVTPEHGVQLACRGCGKWQEPERPQGEESF